MALFPKMYRGQICNLVEPHPFQRMISNFGFCTHRDILGIFSVKPSVNFAPGSGIYCTVHIVYKQCGVHTHAMNKLYVLTSVDISMSSGSALMVQSGWRSKGSFASFSASAASGLDMGCWTWMLLLFHKGPVLEQRI